MNKYEVGYEGELIGVYMASSEKEAIMLCKEDVVMSGFQPDTPIRERLKGMIAVAV